VISAWRSGIAGVGAGAGAADAIVAEVSASGGCGAELSAFATGSTPHPAANIDIDAANTSAALRVRSGFIKKQWAAELTAEIEDLSQKRTVLIFAMPVSGFGI
jgi:hypothetical protein